MTILFRAPVKRLIHVLAVGLGWPSVAFAEVCANERPDWDGASVSGIQEAVLLTASIPSLVLLLITALALRFRNQWAGLAAVCGWSLMIYLLTLGGDAAGVRQQAMSEGCVGSPTLFIAVVFAICVGTILYTAPIERSKPE